jgi:hypothetical protein
MRYGENKNKRKSYGKKQKNYNQRFNARLLMDDEGFYCLGLDNNK